MSQLLPDQGGLLSRLGQTAAVVPDGEARGISAGQSCTLGEREFLSYGSLAPGVAGFMAAERKAVLERKQRMLEQC